jgi:hypothetical protein
MVFYLVGGVLQDVAQVAAVEVAGELEGVVCDLEDVRRFTWPHCIKIIWESIIRVSDSILRNDKANALSL